LAYALSQVAELQKRLPTIQRQAAVPVGARALDTLERFMEALRPH
jgi:hypothetical protein